MFKKFGLLLLSLLAVPTALCAANNISSEVAFAEDAPETLHGYTYHDETRGETNTIYRVFDSSDLNPNAKRNFYAPSGYIFTLDLTDDQITEYVDQMIFMGANFKFIEIGLLYNVSGSDVEVIRSLFPSFPSDDPIETKRDYAIELFKKTLNGYKIFEVKNAASTFYIYPIIDIRMTIDGASYTLHLIFNGNTVKSSKFDVGEYVKVFYSYNKLNNDDPGHMNINAEAVDGFFNEYPYYNEYGWVTDTNINTYDGEIHANYTYSIYAHDDIPLALDKTRLGQPLYLSFPENDLPVKAVIKFTSGGQEYTFESDTVILRDPNASVLIDGYVDRSAIEKNVEHTFELHINDLDYLFASTMELESNIIPMRLNDSARGHELYTNPVLPDSGIEGDYYYIPSSNEIELYNSGKIDELNALSAEGTYYSWNKETNAFEEYKGIALFNSSYDSSENDDVDPASLINTTLSMPFAGKWCIDVKKAIIDCSGQYYSFRNYSQTLDVFSNEGVNEEIILNVPDETNLLLGAGSIDIKPTINTASGLSGEYYFEYELSKQGVVEITQGENGLLNVEPIHAGLVNLRLDVESSLFPKMSKQISIRVLDGAYDSSTIEVADEFHKAGQDLNVALKVRGFTNIQNLDVTWKIVNKKKVVLPSEKIEKHSDATMTFKAPETGDYTISAFIDGIEVANLTVEIRYVDMNNFLRMNIWWIVLTTLGLVFLMIFFFTVTKRSKSTVDRIERVYGVYCQCIANDTLTEPELKRIKREIIKCLHHCEDLNIDAFNQYEKSTRYLRKSLMDTKVLMEKYNDLTPEQKGVLYENLNRDLGKALNVAKEIEAAKNMSEQYHSQANRQNFEVVKEDKSKKNKKNK